MTSGETVDVWQRLRRLSKERIKICARIRRLNLSITDRTGKLLTIGQKYALIVLALEKCRDDLSEEQIDLMLKLVELLSERIQRLTEDIAELAEPNALLFQELDDVEKQMTALEAIVEAEVSGSEQDA